MGAVLAPLKPILIAFAVLMGLAILLQPHPATPNLEAMVDATVASIQHLWIWVAIAGIVAGGALYMVPPARVFGIDLIISTVVSLMLVEFGPAMLRVLGRVAIPAVQNLIGGMG